MGGAMRPKEWDLTILQERVMTKLKKCCKVKFCKFTKEIANIL